MTHTPGPWHACSNGKCSCKTVNCADYPVAKITTGNWGDDYASIRLVGDSSLDQKAEAFMAQFTYGSVNEETATANARLIAAAPDLLACCQLAEVAFKNRDQTEGEANILAAIKVAIAKARGD
jgi:hypothetical protein